MTPIAHARVFSSFSSLTPLFSMSGCTRIFHHISRKHASSLSLALNLLVPFLLSSALSPLGEELDERHPLRPYSPRFAAAGALEGVCPRQRRSESVLLPAHVLVLTGLTSHLLYARPR